MPNDLTYATVTARGREKRQRELAMAQAVFKCLMIASVIIGFNAPVWAQDTDAGKTAYLSSCAPCHGVDAKGSGVFSMELKLQEPPPDLTGLARRNNGVFPARAVNEIIDGTAFLAAHGTREMPIWGFDVMVRSRIAAIVDYLSQIQEK
jgi:mono/diheme cytochrome c family protein